VFILPATSLKQHFMDKYAFSKDQSRRNLKGKLLPKLILHFGFRYCLEGQILKNKSTGKPQWILPSLPKVNFRVLGVLLPVFRIPCS
jgi:hypothetical protein